MVAVHYTLEVVISYDEEEKAIMQTFFRCGTEIPRKSPFFCHHLMHNCTGSRSQHLKLTNCALKHQENNLVNRCTRRYDKLRKVKMVFLTHIKGWGILS
jgi:hypothetical protein